METKEWTNVDRSGWPSGEWDSEPDKVQWQDAETGLPCLAVRNPRSGHWCGYVGVIEGHQAFCKHYDDVDATVHGGLTYSDFCQPHGDEQGKGICHIAGPGEPERVWWLGFDCAHCDDYSPQDAMYARDRGYPFTLIPESKYRSLSYIKNECAELARQLSEMEERK